MQKIPITSFLDIDESKIPKNLEVFPPQATTIRYAMEIEKDIGNRNKLAGCIIGNHMGSGKTHVLGILMLINLVYNTLVITPKNTTIQLAYRLYDMCHKALSVYVFYEGSLRQVKKPKKGPVSVFPIKANTKMDEFSIVITQREQLTTESFRKFLSKYVFDRLVIDEAHVFRNKTDFDGGLKNIRRRTKEVDGKKVNRFSTILSTGTPIQNGKEDIWKLFSIIDKKFIKKIKEQKGKTEDTLKYLIKRYVFRYSIENFSDEMKTIMGFPKFEPKIMNKYVTLEETKFSKKVQKMDWDEIYEQYNEDSSFRKKIIKDERAFLIAVSEKQYSVNKSAMTGIKITYANPFKFSIFSGNSPVFGTDETEYEGKNSKTKMVIDIIKNEVENETKDNPACFVIFYDYGVSKDLYEEEIVQLKNPNFNIFTIDGGSELMVRHRTLMECKDLIKKKQHVILFSSIKTTSEGIDYQMFSRAFFVDHGANPQEENQAITRLQRIGQKHQVKIWMIGYESFRTKSECSNIDERLNEIKEVKKEDLKLLFENAAIFFKTYKIIGSDGKLMSGLTFPEKFTKRAGKKGGIDSIGPDDIDEFSNEQKENKEEEK